MRVHEPGVPDIYLEPGQSRIVHQPAVLKTVLGSCVGVAFRIPRLNVGALCHPMLPSYAERTRPVANHREGRRYVDYAIRELSRKFDELGAIRAEVEVKIFGGADVLISRTAKSRLSVGVMNGLTALRVLEEEGYAVLVSRLGGDRGIHVEFHTGSGAVFVRKLHGMFGHRARV